MSNEIDALLRMIIVDVVWRRVPVSECGAVAHGAVLQHEPLARVTQLVNERLEQALEVGTHCHQDHRSVARPPLGTGRMHTFGGELHAGGAHTQFALNNNNKAKR